MGKTFHLHIVTPEKDFYSGEVASVVLTTVDGEMGILAGHNSVAVALASGPMHIVTGEGRRSAAVIGGFARVGPHRAVVFADTAEWPEDIEEARALEAKFRAEERMQARQSEIEYMRSRVALERALARLTVKHGRDRP